MIAYVLSLNFGREKETATLIKDYLSYENIGYYIAEPKSSLFKKYYKGNNVVVLIFNSTESVNKEGVEPTVLRGFYQVVDYISRNGLVLC